MCTYAYKAVLKYGKATVTNYFSNLETAVDEVIEYIAVLDGKIHRNKKNDEDAKSEIIEYLQNIENANKDTVWTVRLNNKGDDGYIDISRIAVRTGNDEIVSSADIINAISRKNK